MKYEIWHMQGNDIPTFYCVGGSDLAETQKIAHELAIQASMSGNVTILLGWVYVYGGGRYIIKVG
jgi:hypothetical protein